MTDTRDKASEAVETLEELGLAWDGTAWQGRDTQYPPTPGRRLTIIDVGDLMAECLSKRADGSPPLNHFEVIEMWDRMTSQFAAAPKPEAAKSVSAKAHVISTFELVERGAIALHDEISGQTQALVGKRKDDACGREFVRLCALLQTYRDSRNGVDIAGSAVGQDKDKQAAFKAAIDEWIAAADALHAEIMRQAEAMQGPGTHCLEGVRQRLFELARNYQEFRPAAGAITARGLS